MEQLQREFEADMKMLRQDYKLKLKNNKAEFEKAIKCKEQEIKGYIDEIQRIKKERLDDDQLGRAEEFKYEKRLQLVKKMHEEQI